MQMTGHNFFHKCNF